MSISLRDFESMPFEQARSTMSVAHNASRPSVPTVSMAENVDDIIPMLARISFSGPRRRTEPGMSYEELLRLDENNVKRGVTPREYQRAVRERQLLPREVGEVDPITQEPFAKGARVAEIIGCKHLFDPAGLKKWFEKEHICPVCRKDVLQ
eukprot:Sspe_Gene.22199::Locus_8398_Transcript_1_1_Confidence_1.000_Length_899::g.22199::m.22199